MDGHTGNTVVAISIVVNGRLCARGVAVPAGRWAAALTSCLAPLAHRTPVNVSVYAANPWGELRLLDPSPMSSLHAVLDTGDAGLLAESRIRLNTGDSSNSKESEQHWCSSRAPWCPTPATARGAQQHSAGTVV